MNDKNNDVLQNGLQTLLLTPRSRLEFSRSLWNCDLTLEDLQLPSFEGYFRYYQDQCTMVLCDTPSQAKSHREIVNIARMLSDPAMSATRVQPLLSPDDHSKNESTWIFLAVRIMTMIDVGALQHGVRLGQVPRVWNNGSLRDFVKSTFPAVKELPDDLKLERTFTARNLERVAGIQVIWTSNLADHLQLEDDDTSVRIFSHVSFLEVQKKSDIFPPGFIDETLRTLSLLLPPGDKKAIAWLRREQKRCLIDELIDGRAIKCQPLSMNQRQLTNFEFWHDRLAMLKQAFDEADPKTVRQWWSDRRKPVQWFNFWFAVALVVGLTVFFGLVQSIEGALQVYKAYHPSPSP